MAPVHTLWALLDNAIGFTVTEPLWMVFALHALLCAVAAALGVKLGNKLLRADRDGALMATVMLQRDLGQTKSLLANAERRREEMFQKLDGIVQECNSWRNLYRVEASLHGTAQAMMMDERNYFLAQFKRLGKKPRTNRTIDQIVALHEAEHAGPSREALEQLQREQKITEGIEEEGEVQVEAS